MDLLFSLSNKVCVLLHSCLSLLSEEHNRGDSDEVHYTVPVAYTRI